MQFVFFALCFGVEQIRGFLSQSWTNRHWSEDTLSNSQHRRFSHVLTPPPPPHIHVTNKIISPVHVLLHIRSGALHVSKCRRCWCHCVGLIMKQRRDWRAPTNPWKQCYWKVEEDLHKPRFCNPEPLKFQVQRSAALQGARQVTGSSTHSYPLYLYGGEWSVSSSVLLYSPCALDTRLTGSRWWRREKISSSARNRSVVVHPVASHYTKVPGLNPYWVICCSEWLLRHTHSHWGTCHMT